MKYLLFDLDGTLTDPFEGIANSALYAMNKLGLEPVPKQSLRRIIGPPLRTTILELGIAPHRVEEAVEAYREYFAPKGLYENSVYTGVPELPADLKEQGCILALATSKPTKYAEIILKHFNLSDFFSFVGGSQPDGSRSDKHEIIEFVIESLGITDREEIYMLGDRKHDIIGAKKAGVKSIGVLWGYGDEEELKQAGADFIISEISQLREFFNV